MKTAFLILAILSSTAAVAADSSKQRKGTDTICRSIQETGSRLSKKRICMTRDEWSEQKRIMRTEIERAQTRRIEPSSGG